MSMGWEVTDSDIDIVLKRRRIPADPDRVFEEHFVGCPENCDRVEHAALSCTDFDDQCDAALDEIEAILIEAGVIPN